MRSIIFSVLLILIVSSCAHGPKCGTPQGARVVLEGSKTCEIRIRQVTIGSEMKIPSSLKGVGLANFSLEWIEPRIDSGQIELGHFVLMPLTQNDKGSD